MQLWSGVSRVGNISLGHQGIRGNVWEIQQTGLIEELVFEAQFLTEVYIIWFNKALYLDYIIETCFPQSK